MKMAALQLMQQKANKDSNKTEVPAITETSDTPTESNADTSQTQSTISDSANTTEVSTHKSTSQAATDHKENTSKPTTNGPLDHSATQNGECKNPLEGKELEESIPGLAQAKELAETLVAEDGSGIGTSKNIPQKPGQCRESYFGGEFNRIN